MRGGAGLSIGEDGLAYSGPLSRSDALKLASDEDITVETVFESRKTSAEHLGFIFSFGAYGKQCNFALAQRGDRLLLFIKTDRLPSDRNIYEYQIAGVFSTPGKKHVVIVRHDLNINIFCNGVLAKVFEIAGTFSNWDSNARIYVGNDDSGEHSFEGNLFRIAFYNYAFSKEVILVKKYADKGEKSFICYDFGKMGRGNIITDRGGQGIGQNLHIPSLFKVPGKTTLGLPTRHFLFSSSFFKDALINILGFMPLGIFCIFRMKMSQRAGPFGIYLSITIALAVSFAIEVLQGMLPLRSSSLLDLFNNTLGSFLGSLLFLCLRKSGNNR